VDTLLIGQAEVERVLNVVGRNALMDRIIERLTKGLTELGQGTRELSPARNGFERDYPVHGVLEWMPHHDSGHSITIKTVAYSPENPRRYQLPTILSTLARYDGDTGRLLVLTDGAVLTALRTGATSAVASSLLARPESTVVGLIGAGAQAVTQLHALTRMFPVERVLVWDVRAENAASLAARTAFLGLPVTVASPDHILAQADIISTATSTGVGQAPVLPHGHHQGHLHINAVGSDLVGKTELSRSLLCEAFICPDHPEQALREGECQQLAADDAAQRVIGPSLGELCASPGQAVEQRDRLTVFDSTGFALEDHLALDVLLEIVNELGVGSRAQLEVRPRDAFDPYSISRE
jgi:ornithine cyclodeaminase/alanine dehydrogenase-like protein (mu-crystallin family)